MASSTFLRYLRSTSVERWDLFTPWQQCQIAAWVRRRSPRSAAYNPAKARKIHARFRRTINLALQVFG